MKCNELMIWDWCCNGHGLPMQIIDVGEEAYAACKENKGYAWEFSDVEGCNPHPIEITTDILKKNGWREESYMMSPYASFVMTRYFVKDEGDTHLEYKGNTLTIWFNYEKGNDGVYSDIVIPVKYVHQLQQVLRLAGLTDMANNFKVDYE